MSNDIKVLIDYIPKDGKLCDNCIHYEKCPYNYICPSLDRLIKLELGYGEL